MMERKIIIIIFHHFSQQSFRIQSTLFTAEKQRNKKEGSHFPGFWVCGFGWHYFVRLRFHFCDKNVIKREQHYLKLFILFRILQNTSCSAILFGIEKQKTQSKALSLRHSMFILSKQIRCLFRKSVEIYVNFMLFYMGNQNFEFWPKNKNNFKRRLDYNG